MLRSFFICQQLEAVVSKAVLSRVSRMLIHEHRGSTQNKNLFFFVSKEASAGKHHINAAQKGEYRCQNDCRNHVQ